MNSTNGRRTPPSGNGTGAGGKAAPAQPLKTRTASVVKAPNMNSRKRKKGGNRTAALLVTFTVLAALLLIISKILFSSPVFNLADTVYAGNGIYNAFFMNGTGVIDTDIPTPDSEAETAVPEETVDMFGKIKYSPCGVLMAADGTVIIDRSKDKVVYPASLVKLMTAVVTVEAVRDLSAKATLSTDIFKYTTEQNASTAGFSPGEEVPVIDLLYGALIPSGADAALGLARYVTSNGETEGTEEAFVALMNAKAAELGMKNTHFTNCTGLHNNDNYSTAYDIALLFAHAIKNETLRAIITAPEYTTAPTNIHPDGIYMKSTVATAFKKANLEMYPVLGGKTGYTPEAKLCLATFATLRYNGEPTDFILVTLGAGDGTYETQYHAMDAFEVFSPYAAENPAAETGTGAADSSGAISETSAA